METIETKKEAWNIVQGLSKPSKMPGYSYGLPAAECNVGSKLRQIPGSVCSDCYALKGNYTRYPAIIAAQYRRLEAIQLSAWVPAMIKLINGSDFFRWHDSGDIQNLDHLAKICAVCRGCPGTKFWCPSREAKLVNDYVKAGNVIPDNLVIRLSAVMVDSPKLPNYATTSSVHTSDLMAVGRTCPAPGTNGECRDCRACWDPTIANISYHKH